jgi:hypothetical protein
MGVVRHGNYFATALWAGLAAPTMLFQAPTAYPYVIAAGSVEHSFAAMASYIGAAWAQSSAGIQSTEAAQ